MAEIVELTHVDCPDCDEVQPAEIQSPEVKTGFDHFQTIDILCGDCGLVIATVYKELK